jgi:hypothetical protein
MPSKELTPLSIRLNDDVISCLKQEARRVSYGGNKDVSYVDLIRDAVANYVAGIEPTHNQETVRSISVETTDDMPFSSDRISDLEWLKNLDVNEWLELFGLNFNSRLSCSMQRIIMPILEKMSIPRSVLVRNEGEVKVHDRELSSILFVISRRGGVPDEIQEGHQFVPPTFQIACCPQIKIEEILSRNITALAKSTNTAASLIAKEETANFYWLIYHASKNNTIKVPSITLDTLFSGYDALINIGKKPDHLLLSPALFISLSREANQKNGNWNFGSLTQDNSVIGHFCGADIRTIPNMESTEAYFLAVSDGANFIQRIQPTLLISPEPKTLRSGLAIWEDVGMFIHDNMVSCVSSSNETR